MQRIEKSSPNFPMHALRSLLVKVTFVNVFSACDRIQSN